MIEEEELAARVADSARSVVSVVNDSLLGHGRHAADFASRAANPNEDVDLVHELGLFWERAMRDGARFFLSTWTMVEILASEPGDGSKAPPSEPPPSNPLPTTVGPVAKGDPCQPDGLRRRGDTVTTIEAADVSVTRNPNDPSQLQIIVEAGGKPRGLYEGTVRIGSGPGPVVTYNLYVDW